MSHLELFKFCVWKVATKAIASLPFIPSFISLNSSMMYFLMNVSNLHTKWKGKSGSFSLSKEMVSKGRVEEHLVDMG